MTAALDGIGELDRSEDGAALFPATVMQAAAYRRAQRDGPSAADNVASEIRSQTLPEDLGRMLEASARASGYTLHTVALASLSAVLQRATRTHTIALGTQVAGRDSIAAEAVVGPLVNTLILRMDMGGDPTLVELVIR